MPSVVNAFPGANVGWSGYAQNGNSLGYNPNSFTVTYQNPQPSAATAGGTGAGAASAPSVGYTGATAFAPRTTQAVGFNVGGQTAQGPTSYGTGSYAVPATLPQPQYMTADSFSGATANITPQMQAQLNRTLWGQESGPAIGGQWVTWQNQAAADRMVADWNRAAAQSQADAANAQMRAQYGQSQLSYNQLLQDYANQENALNGYGQTQLADIARRYAGYEGKTVQNAISRGLAPQYAPTPTFESGRAGTPLAAMLRGLRYDQEQANNAVNEDINKQKTDLNSSRLQAYERILGAQANQANQQAQLQLERQRLAQQNAQFQQSLAARNTGAGYGGGSSGGSGGGLRQGSGGLPNLGQTGIVNYGQLDRYGYYPSNIPNNIPSGALGGMYSGTSNYNFPTYPAPYAELPGATYDLAGMGNFGGGAGGDWSTGADWMGG